MKRRPGIAGVILAGGRSSRMDRPDKPLRTVDGGPMLAGVIDRLNPQVAVLAVNANGDPQRFTGFGLPVIADQVEGYAGPLAGILAGMDWAAMEPGATHLVSAAGDTPFIPTDLVWRLSVAVCDEGARIAVASSGGRAHPVFALWPLSLRLGLRAFVERGGRKVMAYIEESAFETVDFPFLEVGGKAVDPFFNVNTETDLAEAERIARELRQ